MTAVDVGSLLDAAVAFEARLETFFLELRDKSNDNNLRLLAYYLRRKRRRISDLAQNAELSCLSSLRSMRMTLSAPFSPESAFSVILSPISEIRAEELIEASQKYALELIRIYNIILGNTDSKAVKDALLALRKAEKQDLRMLEKLQSIHYF